MQRAGRNAGSEASESAETAEGSETDAFGWRGWTLVGAIVVAFLLVPATILYLPAAHGLIRSLGLTVRDAYLVLPLLPAFGLGAIAVWSAVRSRAE